MSERIGPSLPHTIEGPIMQQLNDAIKSLKRKSDSSSRLEPPLKKSRVVTSTPRWGVVKDMLPWVTVPLGACPGQVMSSSCLDLPTFINNQPEKAKKRTVSTLLLIYIVIPPPSQRGDLITRHRNTCLHLSLLTFHTLSHSCKLCLCTYVLCYCLVFLLTLCV